MTTAAYHHESGIVAVDSRRTAGGVIVSDKQSKVSEHENGMKIIGTGDPHSIRELSKLYAGESEKLNGSIEYETLLFVIHNKKIARVGYDEGKGFWTEIIDFNIAIGSGALFALSAMDFGCDAFGAIEYAKKKDSYTGGDIVEIKVTE
ncbi:hypothetical protein DMW20_11880 [Vibrio parahaemolyticus]|nr:hypothetical protein [Vibrio parahaemolyticus]